MTAREPNDDSPDKSLGTTRRAFLGAAAAAAGLTTAGIGTSTATTNQRDIDIERDKWGATRASLPKRTDLSSHLQLYNHSGKNATVNAKAYRYDDEESHVSVKVATEHANISMTLSPDEARTIAGDLEAAADVAEGKHGDD